MKQNSRGAILLIILILILLIGILLWLLATKSDSQSTQTQTGLQNTQRTNTDISKLGKSCNDNDMCPPGLKCISYHGLESQGKPLLKTCQIPCPNGNSDCPRALKCGRIFDSKDKVCVLGPVGPVY